MYTRSFFDNTGNIPEGYDGEALREGEGIPTGTVTPTSAPPKISPPSYRDDDEEEALPTGAESSPPLFGIFDTLKLGLPFKGFFRDLGIGKISGLDAEDIILISIAALLFFSEGGDRLLALMLIALLFISK